MPDIPQRITIVNGCVVPAYPEECEPHTPSPAGYLPWFDWAGEMKKTHNQRQCRSCGLWAVWEPKENKETDHG